MVRLIPSGRPSIGVRTQPALWIFSCWQPIRWPALPKGLSIVGVIYRRPVASPNSRAEVTSDTQKAKLSKITGKHSKGENLMTRPHFGR